MDTKDLHIEKSFSAPPEKVFEAWTKPELISKWFSPFPGVDAEVKEFNAVPGSVAKILVTNSQGGEPLIFNVTYVSLNPPKELEIKVMGDAEAHSPTMKATFEPDGAGTKMTFDSPEIPANRFDDASQGWNIFFDKLENVLK